MRTLEEALIHSAELELKMLASLMHDGKPDQQANCYQRISALIMLAYIPDNGLTSGGVAELERIEAEANKLIPASTVNPQERTVAKVYSDKLTSTQNAALERFEAVTGVEPVGLNDYEQGELTVSQLWANNVEWVEGVAATVTNINFPQHN